MNLLSIDWPILTLIIFTPLLGALLVMVTPKEREGAIKWMGVIFTAIPTVLALMAWAAFDPGKTGFQLVEKVAWIPQIGIQYSLGVDGISLPLVVLTALLTLLCVPASWHFKRMKEFMALLLILDVGMLGVFMALDFILFYIFWDVVLVPMYFVIAIWGGPRREYAAIKFFLYTFLGSLFMLLAILALFFYAGLNTFDMTVLADRSFPLALQIITFLGFYLAFAVKVPVFPFHTWLPDAHVEAPTAMSVLLAGVLLKMGGYGFIRISLPTLEDAFALFVPALAILGIINIIYGSYLALAQTDLKKLVAYSSIGHMGFVMLGIAAANATGINGAMFVMIAHGVITGMLFLLVGMVYERTGTRDITVLRGLSAQVPKLGGVLIFTALASMGLPGLAGFWGEFWVLFGAVDLSLTYVALALIGLVITTGYFVWMMQRVNYYTIPDQFSHITDVHGRDLSTIVPLVVFTVLLGLYPSSLLDVMNPTVVELVRTLGG